MLFLSFLSNLTIKIYMLLKFLLLLMTSCSMERSSEQANVASSNQGGGGSDLLEQDDIDFQINEVSDLRSPVFDLLKSADSSKADSIFFFLTRNLLNLNSFYIVNYLQPYFYYGFTPGANYYFPDSVSLDILNEDHSFNQNSTYVNYISDEDSLLPFAAYEIQFNEDVDLIDENKFSCWKCKIKDIKKINNRTYQFFVFPWKDDYEIRSSINEAEVLVDSFKINVLDQIPKKIQEFDYNLNQFPNSPTIELEVFIKRGAFQNAQGKLSKSSHHLDLKIPALMTMGIKIEDKDVNSTSKKITLYTPYYSKWRNSSNLKNIINVLGEGCSLEEDSITPLGPSINGGYLAYSFIINKDEYEDIGPTRIEGFQAVNKYCPISLAPYALESVYPLKGFYTSSFFTNDQTKINFNMSFFGDMINYAADPYVYFTQFSGQVINFPNYLSRNGLALYAIDFFPEERTMTLSLSGNQSLYSSYDPNRLSLSEKLLPWKRIPNEVPVDYLKNTFPRVIDNLTNYEISRAFYPVNFTGSEPSYPAQNTSSDYAQNLSLWEMPTYTDIPSYVKGYYTFGSEVPFTSYLKETPLLITSIEAFHERDSFRHNNANFFEKFPVSNQIGVSFDYAFPLYVDIGKGMSSSPEENHLYVNIISPLGLRFTNDALDVNFRTAIMKDNFSCTNTNMKTVLYSLPIVEESAYNYDNPSDSESGYYLFKFYIFTETPGQHVCTLTLNEATMNSLFILSEKSTLGTNNGMFEGLTIKPLTLTITIDNTQGSLNPGSVKFSYENGDLRQNYLNIDAFNYLGGFPSY